MRGKISLGDLCTVEPVRDAASLEVGAIVLCTVKGKQFLHLVTAVRKGQLQIGNNQGHINGWVSPRAIYGRCVRVEP